MTATSTSTRLRLPAAELDVSQLPAAVVHLSRRSRVNLQTVAHSLSQLDPDFFVLPALVRDTAQSFDLTFLSNSESTMTLTTFLARHCEATQRLPLVLNLARFIGQAFSNACPVRLLPLSPAAVWIGVGRVNPWRLIPLPALDPTEDDWAAADPLTWAWLDRRQPDDLGTSPDAHTLGVMMWHSLAFDGASQQVSRQHRFQEFLKSVDRPSDEFPAALREALPTSLHAEAEELVQMISSYLQPDPARRPPFLDAVAEVDAMAEKLSFDRLISHWKSDLQFDVASQLEKLADELGQKRRVATVSREELAEMPLEEPLAQVLTEIPQEGPRLVRRYLTLVRQLAAGNSERLTAVQVALEHLSQLDQSVPDFGIIDEASALQIAHIQVRYLGIDPAEISLLRRSFTSDWNGAVALALRARALAQTDEYVSVSNHCRKGRLLVESMPNQGGTAGAYLKSYFDLMHGISHIGGAAKFRNLSFYNDGFNFLRQAWEAAHPIGAADVTDSAVRWIVQLSKSTRLLAGTKWHVVHLATQAWLSSLQRLGELPNQPTIPPTPWYREELVFPT